MREDRLSADIEVTRLELSSAQLGRLMSRSQDGRFSCRIPPLALAMERSSRPQAAEVCGVDRQTPRLQFAAKITMAPAD